MPVCPEGFFPIDPGLDNTACIQERVAVDYAKCSGRAFIQSVVFHPRRGRASNSTCCKSLGLADFLILIEEENRLFQALPGLLFTIVLDFSSAFFLKIGTTRSV
jgi:hypothetical protein